MKHTQAVETLRAAGILHPGRVPWLIRRTIELLQLDLTGLTVLTEAASGPYVVTPVIAALAGAERVIALTQASRYASVDQVIAQTQALQTLCGLDDVVEIHTQRKAELFPSADIVTNLGFVRPIDAAVAAAMKPTAVVPLMCEAWEFRPGDVDVAACQQRGIPVVATNEDFPGLEVFDYSGLLCLKMLIDAQIEVHKSTIIVVSSDKFGPVIARQLDQSGACVHLLPNLRHVPAELWAETDALVVADYTRGDTIVGLDGDIEAADLARLTPWLTVIQFAGKMDAQALINQGVFVQPPEALPPHRMAVTLAGLGLRPVIELHAAGLKVGQALANARQRLDSDAAIQHALAHSPAQLL